MPTARLQMYDWNYSWTLTYASQYHALYSRVDQCGAFQMSSASWMKTTQFTDWWQTVNDKSYDRLRQSIMWTKVVGGPQDYPSSLSYPRVDTDTEYDNGLQSNQTVTNTSGHDAEMQPYAEKTSFYTQLNELGDTFKHVSRARYRVFIDGGKSEPIYSLRVIVLGSTTSNRGGGFRTATRTTVPYDQIVINNKRQTGTGVVLTNCYGGAKPTYLTISSVDVILFYDQIMVQLIQ